MIESAPKCPDCGSGNYTVSNDTAKGKQIVLCADCGALISEKSIMAETPLPSGQILNG